MKWTDRPPISGKWCLVRTATGKHLSAIFRNGYWQFYDGTPVENVKLWIFYPETEPPYSPDNLACDVPDEIIQMYIIKKHKEKIEENGKLKTFNQNLTNKYNSTKSKYDELRKTHEEYLRDTSKRLQERNNNVLKLTSENNQLYAKLQELMRQNEMLRLQLDALKFNDPCTPTTSNTTNISES